MPETSLRGRSTRTALRVLRSTEMFICAPAAARILQRETHTHRVTEQNCHSLADAHECHNFTLYNLLWSRVRKGTLSQTHYHGKATTHSVGGWLQCLDMECEDVRVSSMQRENNGDVLGGFWLYRCVWVDGCDNCYLGGEQRKKPSGWRDMELTDKHMHGHTSSTSYLLHKASKSSIFTRSCFVSLAL